MSTSTFVERLAPYIHDLPSGRKNELLLNVVILVFPEGTSEAPKSLPNFYDDLKQLLAEFQPELHKPFDRAALVQALGEYLVDWWAENLKRPLTGRDLDQLLDNLPDYGIREALEKAANEREESHDP